MLRKGWKLKSKLSGLGSGRPTAQSELGSGRAALSEEVGVTRRRPAAVELDRLIEDILVDAYGDHEQLGSFEAAFEENVELPADAFVIGEPVSVAKVGFDGDERRGLTAAVRRDKDSYERRQRRSGSGTDDDIGAGYRPRRGRKSLAEASRSRKCIASRARRDGTRFALTAESTVTVNGTRAKR